MSLYKVGKYWHYSIVLNGERHRGTTHKTDKREAQKVHDDLRLELKQRVSGGFTLADALREWLTDKERSDREKSAIRVLLANYPSRPITEVKPYELIQALSGRADSTINRTISIVNAAINLSAERGKCHRFTIKKRSEEPTALRFLTEQEWETLRQQMQPYLLAIVEFAIETGLRRANVLGLRWRYADIPNRLVWVDSVDAKGKKTISVPLSSRAVEILKAQEGKHEEFVFTYEGKPIRSIKTSWSNAVRKSGIQHVRFHDLRHTWASWKVQKGVPLKVVQELGGWSSLELVQRYAHLDPKHLREWVEV